MLLNSLIALSENIVNLIGFDPGAKSSTLKSFTCLISIPLIDPDSLRIFLYLLSLFLVLVPVSLSLALSCLTALVLSLLIIIMALTAERPCLPLRLAVPDRGFRELTANERIAELRRTRPLDMRLSGRRLPRRH